MRHALGCLLLMAIMGCDSARTGVDWDDSATTDGHYLFVAGYAQSVHVKTIPLNVAAGQDATNVAGAHESAWNAILPGTAESCPSDPTIVRFPRNVGEMVLIDKDLNVYEIGASPTALPNGLIVRMHRGRCPR